MSKSGYWGITSTPGPNLESHNRPREFKCRRCGATFTAYSPNALWCPDCQVSAKRKSQAKAAKKRKAARVAARGAN